VTQQATSKDLQLVTKTKNYFNEKKVNCVL
jgi:hypothetical protein